MLLDIDDVAIRLGAAAAAGAAIGLNRDLRGKQIGMRTLALVSLGAATVTIATIQVDGMWEDTDALSRVVQGLIQGLMAGIGFIGAGVILRKPNENVVQGLTTAATVLGDRSLRPRLRPRGVADGRDRARPRADDSGPGRMDRAVEPARRRLIRIRPISSTRAPGAVRHELLRMTRR